jgi:hypothetical protein
VFLFGRVGGTHRPFKAGGPGVCPASSGICGRARAPSRFDRQRNGVIIEGLQRMTAAHMGQTDL